VSLKPPRVVLPVTALLHSWGVTEDKKREREREKERERVRESERERGLVQGSGSRA
jgi:hypothetical protein